MLLSDEEIRVLGCLVEKALTTPQQYPLSEAAVIAAANQTTNRHPVVDYDQSTVRRALRSLRQQGLARLVQRPSDRTEKHQHLLDVALELDAAQTALLALLALRGPQTVAELRSRSARLHAFASADEVVASLEALASRDEPLVARLPRQRGHSQDRYGHLFQGELLAVLAPEDPVHTVDEASGPPRTLAALLEEVSTLRDEVAALRAEVAALREDA